MSRPCLQPTLGAVRLIGPAALEDSAELQLLSGHALRGRGGTHSTPAPRKRDPMELLSQQALGVPRGGTAALAPARPSTPTVWEMLSGRPPHVSGGEPAAPRSLRSPGPQVLCIYGVAGALLQVNSERMRLAVKHQRRGKIISKLVALDQSLIETLSGYGPADSSGLRFSR